jgi:hypothetical protein
MVIVLGNESFVFGCFDDDQEWRFPAPDPGTKFTADFQRVFARKTFSECPNEL